MLKNKKIQPNSFTPSIGSYSHGIVTPISTNVNMIFITGQIALDKNGDVYCPNDIEKQTEFVFKNIKLLLEEANSSMADVVKAQIFLTNINDFKKVSPIRNKFFKNSKPVSTMIEVSKLVKDDCLIEIEVIAIQREKNIKKRLLNILKNLV